MAILRSRIAELRNTRAAHSFFSLLQDIMACTRCHVLKRKCDKQGDAPCSKCANLGLECVVREGKTKKTGTSYNNGRKRAAPGTVTARKKTKTAQEKGGASVLNTLIPDMNGNHFISPAADSYALSVFQDLSPDHWGLQSVVRSMIIITAVRASWGLCAAISWLVRKTGLSDAINFFCSSRVAEREYKVGDFGHVSDFVLRFHDERVGATGAPPWSAWDEDSLGDRLLFVSSNEHIEEGVVSASPCYHEMFATKNRVANFKDRFSIPFQDGASFMYDKNDFTRCTRAIMDIMRAYKTRNTGPITRCVTGVTMHHPQQGKIKGNNWVTIYLGQEGLDGKGIHEFIPGEAPTAPSIETIGEIGAQDRSAAEAIVQLFGK